MQGREILMESYSETQNMYFIGRDGIEIEYIYKLPTNKLLPLISEKATGNNKTDGHKSFNIKKLKDLGATLSYYKTQQNGKLIHKMART